MGLFRRPVTAIWPNFGRVSDIAEIRLREAVSPFCCFGSRSPREIFRRFFYVSGFSLNILTFPQDSQNGPFSAPSYRDLARFRPRSRDRRNPTSRGRFAVLLLVFGSRSACEIFRRFFAGFWFPAKYPDVSLGFPKWAFCGAQLPRFGAISAAFLRLQNPTSRNRFAVTLLVFGRRSFCEIFRQFFADFGFFAKHPDVSL